MSHDDEPLVIRRASEPGADDPGLDMLSAGGRQHAGMNIDLRDAKGVSIGASNEITQIFRGSGRVASSAYLDLVRDIAPERLLDREEELDRLARSCWSPEPYEWWYAKPWAGKSALMSTFVLNPPAGVDVVCFFVTARFSGQANSIVFTEALLEQLASITGEDLPASPIAEVRAAHREQLLRLAAHRSRESGRRLVLVVDGLDEDGSRQPGSSLPSIAALLPRRPVPGLKVIIASRPHPPPPKDVPGDHAIHTAARHTLAPSRHASDVERMATEELRRLLGGTADERQLLGLIAVSGGLSGPDLRALSDTPYMLEQHLHGLAGRTIQHRGSGDGDESTPYVLAHETLRAEALSQLGDPLLEECRSRIHRWADRYRDRSWPRDTPEYLVDGYPEMLRETGDARRMAALATDPGRHALLRARTGGDVSGLQEISAGQNLVLAQPRPDLATLICLAAHRDVLNARNTRIPVGLPTVWLRLGDTRRALALAGLIEDRALRDEAQSALARGLLARGDREDASLAAHAVANTKSRAGLLTELARGGHEETDARERVGVNDWQLFDAAVGAATGITDADDRASAVDDLVELATDAGAFDRALELAELVESPGRRVSRWLRIADAMLDGERERGLRLLERARGAWNPGDEDQRAETAARFAQSYARYDMPGLVVEFSDRIVGDETGNPFPLMFPCMLASTALAAVGEFRRAVRLAERSLAGLLDVQTNLLALLTAGRADTLPRDLHDPLGDFRGLLGAFPDPLGDRARPLGRDRLSIFRTAATYLCEHGRHEEAIQIAESIEEPAERAAALAALAGTFRTTGHDDAAVRLLRDSRNTLTACPVDGATVSSFADLMQAHVDADRPAEAEAALAVALLAVDEVDDESQRGSAWVSLITAAGVCGLLDQIPGLADRTADLYCGVDDAEVAAGGLLDLVDACLNVDPAFDVSGYVEDALDAIDEIDAAKERDSRLAKLGRALTRAPVVALAGAVIARITERRQRFSSLAAVLPALLAAGELPDASGVVRELGMLATDLADVDDELVTSAVAIAEAGYLDLAIGLADACPAPATVLRAWVGVTRTAAAGPAPAGLAHLVDGVTARAGAAEPELAARELTTLVVPVTRALPQRFTLRLAHRIIDIADTISHQDPRASALVELSHALLDSDITELAAQTAKLAESAAQVDAATDLRGEHIRALAEALCRSEDSGRLARVATWIEDPAEREAVVAACAEEARAAGDLADEELRARRNTDPYLQASGLVDVARGFASAQDRVIVRRILTDAERQSHNIKNTYFRCRVWIELADVLLTVGASDEARRLADEARRLLPSVSFPQSRAMASAKLTGVLIRLGAAGTDDLATETAELARALTKLDGQAEVLCGLARAVAPAHPDRSRRLLAEAVVCGSWTAPLPAVAALEPQALAAVVDQGTLPFMRAPGHSGTGPV